MIRKASVEDIPTIRAMAGKAFPFTYKEILSSEQIDYMMDMMYSEKSLLRQMTVQNNIFYICEGKGYVSFRHEGRVGEGIELYHLEKLYVLPEFQGSGVGRVLVNTVIDAARKLSPGRVRIELNVNRSNKAVKFYEHIGMRRCRQGDFPIGNGYFMNDYIMAIDC